MKSTVAHNSVLTYTDNAGVVHTWTWRLKCLLAVLLCLAGLVAFSSCSERKADPEEEEWDNSIIESVLKKPNLKVLDIGNSYTNDATALLPTVVKNSGADVNDMCLYSIVRPGGSFMDWCSVYADTDIDSYSFIRVVGGNSVGIPSKRAEAGDGSLFREVLSEVEWDIIIIHQFSVYAPYYEQWDGYGAGGYLDVLLSIIKKHQPNAQIGFMLIHSYWDGYSGNKEKSSLKRWQKIADSVRQLCKEYHIRFVIPYGTAIENLRASSLNNEYDLTRDGTHCGLGICQYTAACCYYESLIAPRTGVTCLGTPAQIDVSKKESKYPGINVTKSNAEVAQKAALMAVKDMFHCNNPE